MEPSECYGPNDPYDAIKADVDAIVLMAVQK